MKKNILFLMAITIVSKLFGFARDITLSYFYGASRITDAYLISITIPSVIFGFIGAGIATGYIPMYSQIEKEEGVKAGNKYTNNLVNFTILICTIMFIFGLICTVPIVKIFASGFTGETLELTVKFTRIGLVGMYFTGLLSIFSGFLQIKGNYAIPALVGFPLNFFTILAIIISSKGNVFLLAFGTVIATASQLLLVLPFAYKKGYKYKRVFDLKDKHIKNMAYTKEQSHEHLLRRHSQPPQPEARPRQREGTDAGRQRGLQSQRLRRLRPLLCERCDLRRACRYVQFARRRAEFLSRSEIAFARDAHAA